MAESSVPVVHKFGGTSIEDASRIRDAAHLVADRGTPAVVVVSALAGVTQQLVDSIDARPEERARVLDGIARRHRDVLMDLNPTAEDASIADEAITTVFESCAVGTRDQAGFRDRWLAVGEDLSVHLVAAGLRSAGVHARVIDARECIRTDDSLGGAIPQHEALGRAVRDRLGSALRMGVVPVVQGFVGADSRGRTTTLGRGGSDFTAVLIGAALDAAEVLIWTDVPGMHTADPGSVAGARVIPELGFEEAVELAYFGAGVLHPAAAKHAVAERVPLRILDTRDPSAAGTVIRHDTRGAAAFAAVAYKPDVVMIEVRARPSALEHGFLAKVFSVLGRHHVAVDLVATSHSSTAFTVDRAEELSEVHKELESFAAVRVVENLATVTVVGHGLLARPGLDAQAFWSVGTTPVHLISQASDVSLSLVVDQMAAHELVRRLHAALIRADAEPRPDPDLRRVEC